MHAWMHAVLIRASGGFWDKLHRPAGFSSLLLPEWNGSWGATVLWGESSEMIYSSVSARRVCGAVAPMSRRLVDII